MEQRNQPYRPAGVQNQDGRVRSPDEVVWRELEDELADEIAQYEQYLLENGEDGEDF